jgi:hypothetical protein
MHFSRAERQSCTCLVAHDLKQAQGAVVQHPNFGRAEMEVDIDDLVVSPPLLPRRRGGVAVIARGPLAPRRRRRAFAVPGVPLTGAAGPRGICHAKSAALLVRAASFDVPSWGRAAWISSLGSLRPALALPPARRLLHRRRSRLGAGASKRYRHRRSAGLIVWSRSVRNPRLGRSGVVVAGCIAPLLSPPPARSIRIGGVPFSPPVRQGAFASRGAPLSPHRRPGRRSPNTVVV